MRIYNFPNPYPGELFYSAIARFKLREGMNRSNIGNILFDNRQQEISFPCVKNLQTVCTNLGSSYTPEEIIDNHSLLYIYLPFLDFEKQQLLLDNILMKDLDKRCCIDLDGLSLDKDRFVMYCPVCAKEDMELYGETYIHREHQIPKIKTCYKHGTKLLDYSFDYNKFGDLCNLDYSNMLTTSDLDKELNWKIAKDASDFLNLHRICSKEDFAEKYIAIFTNAGYCYNSQQIDKNRISHDYLEFYGQEFIQKFTDIGLLDKNNFNEYTNWICSLKSQSLLQHILLLNFFGISITQFYDINEGLDLNQTFPSRIKSIKDERTDDEKICKQLKHFYERRAKEAYKYKELMLETMFKGIGLKHWRNLIKD
ncbi:MAG TPA: TnsD family Tn7-like transposition protein, partial [Patescibacteria group bacterium]|nr:TnsD family Tn7-like transposition protein [Patescibacteria group bacterium]